MKKNIFYALFVLVPGLFLYLYTVYRASMEDLFQQDPLAVTGFTRIGFIFIPLIIATILIFLSLYSLRFSNSKSFYIGLTVVFIIYLVLSILPFFSTILSLPTSKVALYLMNNIPWYAGYYGGTLLFAYVYNKKAIEPSTD